MTNRLFILLLFSFIPFLGISQFSFSGQVSDEFIESQAFLIEIDDYKKCDLFLSNQIIQQTAIDSLGNFYFSGNFLKKENKFYQIHIDQCHNSVSDTKHLLNHCDNNSSIIFIANSTDSIHFPLNNLQQAFCSLQHTRQENAAIQKIDSLQNYLLHDLQDVMNNKQRHIIFSNYLKEIQNYSTSFHEPLVELYAYQLYSNRKSFGRKFYLEDLKKSDYYNNLLHQLKTNYPHSAYTKQFELDLQKDSPKKENTFILYGILTILGISIGINILFFKKNRAKKKTVQYKDILSTQEQKVFELMHQGLSNKEIAEKLFISLSTVKSHINTIYSKLGITSRKEISAFFN